MYLDDVFEIHLAQHCKSTMAASHIWRDATLLNWRKIPSRHSLTAMDLCHDQSQSESQLLSFDVLSALFALLHLTLPALGLGILDLGLINLFFPSSRFPQAESHELQGLVTLFKYYHLSLVSSASLSPTSISTIPLIISLNDFNSFIPIAILSGLFPS